MAHAHPLTGLDRKQLREAFETFLPLPEGLEPHLEGALRQVLGNPGSLVRPQLVFQVATAYGVEATPATDLAVALEYFHTASLIFDDLPCMDDANERRGAECAHVTYGESGALLAALGIINRAYALAWRAVAACPANRQVKALECLEHHLGVGGLLNGQSMDLHYATLVQDLKTTERVALGKTVSLVKLAIVLPAVLCGADRDELQLLERISLFWGLAYQILDDLKDVMQSSAQTGKTAARDFDLGRPNIAHIRE